MFKVRRLIYFESPEHQAISQEIEKASVDAITLDDEEVLWSESEVPDKFAKDCDAKATAVIPSELRLENAKAAYAEIGGDNAVNLGNAAMVAIRSAFPQEPETWGDEEKQKAIASISKMEERVSLFLQSKILAAGSFQEAVNSCNLAALHEQRKGNLEKAENLNGYKEAVVGDVRSIAAKTIEKKQLARFEAKKEAYIQAKVDKIFGEGEDLEKKKNVAKVFLGSLFSNAPLKVEESEVTAVFDECYGKTNEKAIKQYVSKLVDGEIDDNPEVKEDETILTGVAADQEVSAYIHGLMASFRSPDGTPPSAEQMSKYRDWAHARLQIIPEDEMTLENVKKALSTIHIEHHPDYLQNTGLKDAGFIDYVKGGNEHIKTINKMFNANPAIMDIYNQKMAEAHKAFSGLPDYKEEMDMYKTSFLMRLASIGDPARVDLIEAIVPPAVGRYGSQTISKLPDRAQTVKGTPSTKAVAMARRAYESFRKNNAPFGTIVEFNVLGGDIYYAQYVETEKGDNVVLFQVPPKPYRPKPVVPDEVEEEEESEDSSDVS